MSNLIALIGRICMSAVFIVYGIPKVMDSASVMNHAGAKRFFDLVLSGTPVPSWFGYFIGGVEILGGLAILLGIKTRWVAWLIVIYLVLITAFSHGFWLIDPAKDAANFAIQRSNFFKNIAILGGFLILALHGPGAISFDGRSASSRME
jgi:putative oxidoreductase